MSHNICSINLSKPLKVSARFGAMCNMENITGGRLHCMLLFLADKCRSLLEELLLTSLAATLWICATDSDFALSSSLRWNCPFCTKNKRCNFRESIL